LSDRVFGVFTVRVLPIDNDMHARHYRRKRENTHTHTRARARARRVGETERQAGMKRRRIDERVPRRGRCDDRAERRA